MDGRIWRERGLRLTPQRELILRLLEECSGHVVPEEIYQRVHEQLPMVNRSTVYRTLDVLEGLGLVRHSHDGTGAARYHLGEYPHHLHLFCHRCGQLVEVDDLQVVEPVIAALRERYDFAADLTHFPISGLCRDCQESTSAEPHESA